MKLSMWMLANRLASLDPELHIHADAPRTLKSARRAFATDCVCVGQSGPNVICHAGEDYFILYGMDVQEAVELLQSIFDFYEDWHQMLLACGAQHDLQSAIDRSWHIFENPMLVMDGNRRVLALSSRYGADEIDREWQYLKTYGHASVASVRQMRHMPEYGSIFMEQAHYYGSDAASDGLHAGLTCCVTSEGTICARLNVLEHARPINPGDYQSLEFMARTLGPFLRDPAGEQTDAPIRSAYLHLLLKGRPVEPELVRFELSYHGWNDTDYYQLYLLKLDENVRASDLRHLLYRTLASMVTDSAVFYFEDDLVLLCDRTTSPSFPSEEWLEQFALSNHVVVSASQAVAGISRAACLLSQARAAAWYGQLEEPGQRFYSFFPYAMDYMLEAPSLKDRVLAVQSDLYALWVKKLASGDDMYDTLESYLRNARSLVNTSQELYIHRNTLVYRIHKISDLLTCSLDDVYTRDYIRLSIRILNLFEKTWQQQSGRPLDAACLEQALDEVPARPSYHTF